MLTLNRFLAALLIIGAAICTATAGQDSQTRKGWDGKKKARASDVVMDFETIKQKRSAALAQKIEQLSIYKACVDGAVDQAAMGTCQKEHRAAQKDIKRPVKGQIDADGVRKRIRDKTQSLD